MLETIKKKAPDYFGAVKIDHTDPPYDGRLKSLNMVLSLEEALKLQVALQAAILELNSCDRGTPQGKVSGLSLCVFLGPEPVSMTINAGKLRTAKRRTSNNH